MTEVVSTLKRAHKLRELFTYLLAWMIYSDGIGTINTVAILYCKTNLHASDEILLISGIVTIIFAAVGCVIWPFIQQMFNLSTRQVVMIHSVMYALVPLYAIFLFDSVIEIIPVAAYLGMIFGATSSSNRVLFSHLIPPGLESEFFGLYAITDKGSAWFGIP